MFFDLIHFNIVELSLPQQSQHLRFVPLCSIFQCCQHIQKLHFFKMYAHSFTPNLTYMRIRYWDISQKQSERPVEVTVVSVANRLQKFYILSCFHTLYLSAPNLAIRYWDVHTVTSRVADISFVIEFQKFNTLNSCNIIGRIHKNLEFKCSRQIIEVLWALQAPQLSVKQTA